MRYIRKPIAVDAVQHRGTLATTKRIERMTRGSRTPARVDAKGGLVLLYAIANQQISPTDWVVNNTNGTFSVLTETEFKKQYAEKK